MVSESYPNSLNKALVYIIHIIQSRKTLSQCNDNSKVTESKQSRLCERVGRRDVRASRSTRNASRSVKEGAGRRCGHGGRGSLGRAGGSFSEGGRGARLSISHSFWKIRHYSFQIYIFPKILYKALRQLFRQAFRGHSDKLSNKHSTNRRPKALKLPFLIPLLQYPLRIDSTNREGAACRQPQRLCLFLVEYSHKRLLSCRMDQDSFCQEVTKPFAKRIFLNIPLMRSNIAFNTPFFQFLLLQHKKGAMSSPFK